MHAGLRNSRGMQGPAHALNLGLKRTRMVHKLSLGGMCNLHIYT